MGDILDRASELEEFHLQAALASRPRPAPAYSISATICDDCGSEIPQRAAWRCLGVIAALSASSAGRCVVDTACRLSRVRYEAWRR